MHKPSVQEIRLGALYRIGPRLAKKTLIELMTDRAGLKREDAERLAEHWLTTEPYRMERKMNRFAANETVYCRFTREAFTVVSCNGCIATLSDGSTRIVGELTRIPPNDAVGPSGDTK